jgi:hypothetical protein
MSEQEPTEFEEARLRMLLHGADDDIRTSRSARFNRRRGGRPVAVVALTIVALAASAGTGFAFGRSVPATTTTTQLSALPLEPPIIELALQQMLQLHDPDIVVRIDSITVKYVTDQEFTHAISSAWKTDNPAACGTFSGPTGAVGHWYVVDLHGKFVAESGVPTKYASVAVVMVPASDLRTYLQSHLPSVPGARPGQPTPESVTAVSSNFGFPPIGTDGQPLCWSLLPNS